MNERIIGKIKRLEQSIEETRKSRDDTFNAMQTALANGAGVISLKEAASIAHSVNLIAGVNHAIDDMETQVAFLKSLS